MAKYGLYANVNTATLRSEASSLKSKLQTSKNELESFKGTLTDDIWKANAKTTLINAYTKIDTDIYNNLINKLAKIEEYAALVDAYKRYEAAARTNRSKLSIPNLDKTSINNLNAAIYEQEQAMDNYENKINTLVMGG